MPSIIHSLPAIRSRLGRGTSAQVLFHAVQIIIRLAEVPLFIGFWGIHLYGEWLILAAIPTYLSLGDLGFVSAACREMSMRSSAGKQKEALAVFQSTWALLLVISLIIILLVVFLIDIVQIENWFGFVSIHTRELKIILLLLSGHVLIDFQSGLLTGGFWCSGRYPLSIFWSTVTHVFEFCGIAIALSVGGTPIQAATCFFVGRLLGAILTWISLVQVVPWIRFGLVHASIDELKQLLSPALASLAIPMGNTLNIQGIRIAIGIVMGPTAVAMFTPMRTLSRFAMQPPVLISRVIEPELSLIYGQRNFDLFSNLYTHACQIAFWIGIAVCLLLVMVSNWLFPLWTDGRVILQWPLYFLLLLGVAIHDIWHTALMAPYAANRHGRIAIFYCVVYGMIALIVGYAGAVAMGLIGVGLSLIFVEIAMAVCVIPVALKFSQLKWKIWFGTIRRPPFFLFLYCKNIILRTIFIKK